MWWESKKDGLLDYLLNDYFVYRVSIGQVIWNSRVFPDQFFFSNQFKDVLYSFSQTKV